MDFTALLTQCTLHSAKYTNVFGVCGGALLLSVLVVGVKVPCKIRLIVTVFTNSNAVTNP